MESTVQLKEKLEPIFVSCNVKLYEIIWLNHAEHTLQIAIMHEDGSMDLDTCALVSEKISAYLDEHELIRVPYTLEVCSPGAEREIKDIDELSNMTNPYVYLRIVHPLKSKREFIGTVISYQNNQITLEYREKAAKRTIEVEKENVEFIRLAVKI